MSPEILEVEVVTVLQLVTSVRAELTQRGFPCDVITGTPAVTVTASHDGNAGQSFRPILSIFSSGPVVTFLGITPPPVASIELDFDCRAHTSRLMADNADPKLLSLPSIFSKILMITLKSPSYNLVDGILSALSVT